MKTNEVRIERNGALLYINTYEKELYIATRNICKFKVVRAPNTYFWNIQIDLADMCVEKFGLYEKYDNALLDLRELLDKIYGPNPGDVGTTSEIPLRT